MTTLADISHWIDERLGTLAEQYNVPAVSVAVYADGEVIDRSAGILNLATGVEATTDSVFQIGSITKLWTATLVMQLADEGLVDIDRPVREYLPEFQLGDDAAAAVITIRQLLSHTAGFEGDIFTDTGRNDDAVKLLIAGLGDVPQLFPPGEQFSYNNVGYCVLGRLVEVLREKPFSTALRDHLITPLGLAHAVTGADEAIMFRAAVGHVQPEAGAAYVPAPFWALAYSNAPAGTTLTMRARDLITFARMQMNGGAADDGTVVLSPGAVSAMQERQVELPYFGLLGDAWGLGWEIYDTPAGEIIGHDGSTLGQNAFLRIAPEKGVAVALLTNGGEPFGLYHEMISHVLSELADVELPPMPVPPSEPKTIDPERFLGTYSSRMLDLDVTQDEEGRVWMTMTATDAGEEIGVDNETTELVWLREDTLIPLKGQQGMHLPHAFLGDDGTGRAQYLHLGRAVRRAASH
ncbi:serine hydrolase domain-containing protein [Arthrobacter zhaoguopingii]|uniref:serine hydrolase domain-containing protein n=1 Tax=Arthrobacter zhaoguopingii TaxID=2681491 RepID=UPI00135CCA1D|nr:serine hydrolase domain-containing protein [Arthrobacter zhaoguopingii]